MIRYCEKVESTQLLGPGDRAVLWAFGCCFDCPGCIAQRFRRGPFMEATEEELAQWVLNTGRDGLTISGGEPMLQASALGRMLQMVHSERDVGVVVYTGFVYEALLESAKNDPGLRAFLDQIDLLIDGPYMGNLDHNEPYRGSSNQRLLPLTTRYEAALSEYYGSAKGRRIEVKISEEKTMMIGVPSRDQAVIWQEIKQMSPEETGA